MLHITVLKKTIALCHGASFSRNTAFFWSIGLLFLITYPICDIARQTLYGGEVLAPGAGHRGASGLISNQVIRQTGGGI